MEELSLTQDFKYLALFTLVLVFPKILLRWRIPTGITALLIGIALSHFDPKVQTDQLFRFLAQIGITSLFVFAGLEVNFEDLKKDRVYLSQYLLKSVLALLLIGWAFQGVFSFSFQSGFILALGILTPSAGFIINSLHSFEMGKDIEYWIKSKAISKEIVAIALLFVALQANDMQSMLISSLFFVSLFIFLPLIFKFFFKFVSPYAKHSEVPFLVVISLISGVMSKELGTYYLVGAFIVGLIGSRFKKEIFSDNEEAIFRSLNSFFNVFLPFYFFYAGLKLSFTGVTQQAVTLGFTFLVIFVPLRLILNSLSLKYFFKNIIENSYQISLSLMPTLIFGLVIAGILKDRGEVPGAVIYALVLYTLLVSLIPSVLFRVKK